MNEIRIGLAGLGHRGRNVLHLLQGIPGFRIVALCDSVAALHRKGIAALRDRKHVKLHQNYDEFLADEDVDAVVLTVRCREQGALAARALEAGKHVNAEVPAAHTLEDCRRIVAAQERTGRIYLLAEQMRYAGYIEEWRKLVGEGALGRITYAEGQYFHYYVKQSFRNPATGEFYPPQELAAHPEAKPTWLCHMPPIHYLVHDLSPILRVLDDRVIEVTAMSTDSPSFAHSEIESPDMQVALMKTVKGALLRLAVSFAQPHPETEQHWQQIIGTRGSVEWKRSARDTPKIWLANSQVRDKSDADWSVERPNDSSEMRESGHGGLDYHVHAAFRDAVLGGKSVEFDVYRAMDVAVAGILAADSIAQGGKKLRVPDLRPRALRTRGRMPKQRSRKEDILQEISK